MLICKGDISYRCSEIVRKSLGATRKLNFFILDCITPVEVANLFADDTFYFYDDILGGRLIGTNDTKMVGLRIEYNADSTCYITIKLTIRSGKK